MGIGLDNIKFDLRQNSEVFISGWSPDVPLVWWGRLDGLPAARPHTAPPLQGGTGHQAGGTTSPPHQIQVFVPYHRYLI